MKTYAGIGSTETPFEIGKLMTSIASKLETKGYILRSGGAEGADTFFENGVINPKKKEIYLPWHKFNNNKSQLYTPSKEAFELAKKYHPSFDYLSFGAKALMARNGYQVLGLDLNTPSNMIICWTKNGKAIGGTGQALRIAKDYDIKIYNLHDLDIVKKFEKFLED